MSLNNTKSKNIPNFLQKTYNMLQDSINQVAVQWSPNGVGFIILNEELLTKSILPKYFKHSNYSSFIRQLNMYDFHKIRKGNIENYFHHDKFIRGDLYSISHIKRKPQKKKALKNITNSKNYSSERYYCSQSEIQSDRKVQTQNKKSQITLNSIHTIKPKSQQSIILMRQNTNMLSKLEPIYYEECESANDNNFSHIDLNRGDSYENQEQNHHHNDDDSSKMSINNEIQSTYLISQSKEILIPSHNNIFHFINPYQLANFGLFM